MRLPDDFQLDIHESWHGATFTHWIKTIRHRCILYHKMAVAHVLVLLENVTVVDDDKELTPLRVTSQCGNARVARLLLEHGANIHVQNKKDQTPQHLLLAMLEQRIAG